MGAGLDGSAIVNADAESRSELFGVLDFDREHEGVRDDRVYAITEGGHILSIGNRAQERQEGDEGTKKVWKVAHYTKIRTE